MIHQQVSLSRTTWHNYWSFETQYTAVGNLPNEIRWRPGTWLPTHCHSPAWSRLVGLIVYLCPKRNWNVSPHRDALGIQIQYLNHLPGSMPSRLPLVPKGLKPLSPCSFDTSAGSTRSVLAVHQQLNHTKPIQSRGIIPVYSRRQTQILPNRSLKTTTATFDSMTRQGNSGSADGHQNRLAHAKSPYLLQHVSNPVVCHLSRPCRSLF